ncbi:probable cytochrome P450 28d1 [Toxorhynchites rutilus septentrionalis]|uniref:probable cytochrome P450 28d1 n=1 Tax=Toxorhynchites rutilus septentrionalis TaxID=329112 RepID=UPI00247A46DB|nr:probable cytochrome P450 28d1 [Toxorhynchites rutilus septentrionalis]
MLCTIVGIVAGLVRAVYMFLAWEFNRWKKVGINGPKPKLLFGNVPSVLTQKRHPFYDYQEIYNDYKDEPVVGYFSIRTPQLMIRDPELIKEVLSKSFLYFAANDMAGLVDEKSDPLMSRNPFGMTGEKWKTTRAEITPAFTANRIRALFVLMEQVCGRMTEHINQNIAQNECTFDAKELMTKYTTDVVSNCIFAIDAQSFTKEKPEIREMGRRIMDFNVTAQIIFGLITFIPSIRKFYKFTFIPRDVEEFFIRVMREAIQHRKKHKIVRNDYLDHLLALEEKKQISEIDIAGHGVSFFADGFETSSWMMTFCLYDLASHPAIQRQLREEIRTVQANKKSLDYDNISEMTFLEQVCNETLRLHLVVPLLVKRCTEDVELVGPKDKKIRITAGTTVTIPYFVHFDPLYYDEPEKYKPERFAPETGGTKSYREKGVYFPFGDGPRMCLGMRFALAQAKRGIVEIINRYEITVNPRTKEPLEYDPKLLMLNVVGGIWLDFKPLAAGLRNLRLE